ncbi:MAG: type II toxin-antitoxin system VapC family toxin [Terriglobales bacterium]
MRTALDTNIISTQWAGTGRAPEMTTLLDDCRREGSLIVAGVVYAELLARPNSSIGLVNEYLISTGIEIALETSAELWEQAGSAYADYCRRRSQSGGGESKRLLADFIIGAHAMRNADRLATLDPARYRAAFPDLVLIP